MGPSLTGPLCRMEVSIDRSSTIPVYRQIVEQVRSMVASAALPVGSALPTVRELAVRLDVSRLTVHKAYQELQEMGLVCSRRRHGTTVAPIQDEETGLQRLAGFLETGPFSDFEVICARTNVRSMASPVPDPRLFDVDEFLSCHNVLRGEANWTHYYPTGFGDDELARLFQLRLRPYGVEFDRRSFIPLGGRNPAMVVLARALFPTDRPIATQEPHALGTQAWFQSQDVRCVGVPANEHGLDTDALERACKVDKVSTLVAMPNFGLIDGLRWPEENRKAVAQILSHHGVKLVERAGHSVLAFEPDDSPTMGSLMPEGQAYVACSFQQSLAPGLDLAFVGTNGGHDERLAGVVSRSGLLMSRPLRLTGAEFLRRALEPNVSRIVGAYRARRDALVTTLSRSLPEGCTFTVPVGGYCLYVRLPRPVDPETLFRTALDQKIAVMPGRFVSASGGCEDGVALSYSMLDPAALESAGLTFGRLLKSLL